MSEQSLRLVKDKPVTSDPLKFERRQMPRHSAVGQVTAIARRQEEWDGPHKICSFELSDMSSTGLGVISPDPIEVGDEVTVYLPPHGPESGFDLQGVVVRCEPHGSSHHALGIRVAPRHINAA